MTEPNKSLSDAIAILKSQTVAGQENRNTLFSCAKHNFIPVEGSDTGLMKCVHCGGTLSAWNHAIYLQGMRDGGQS